MVDAVQVVLLNGDVLMVVTLGDWLRELNFLVLIALEEPACPLLVLLEPVVVLVVEVRIGVAEVVLLLFGIERELH